MGKVMSNSYIRKLKQEISERRSDPDFFDGDQSFQDLLQRLDEAEKEEIENEKS